MAFNKKFQGMPKNKKKHSEERKESQEPESYDTRGRYDVGIIREFEITD